MGDYVDSNQKFFTDLKIKAIERNDNFQELIFRREIAKCQSQVLKQENWKSSWQDRFVLFFGWSFSNHGVSWLRPMVILIIVNFFIAWIVYWVYPYPNFSHVFWELFNPIGNLAKTVTNSSDQNGFLSFLNVLQKIILALTIYEIIKTFRRFGAK